jgi:hypothetical protein
MFFGPGKHRIAAELKTPGPDGYYLLNLYAIPTVNSNLGLDRYPTRDESLPRPGPLCSGYEIPATYKAAELGSPQMTNVVMQGP